MLIYPSYKRFFDIILSIFIILLILPLLVLFLIILSISLRGNPIFIQLRVGINERVFSLYKLRSMSNRYDNYGILLPDKLRVTKIGSFMRSFSLDELPQLVNVLLGHMSIVGPRPLLQEYVPLYNKFQKRRHEVKPGITGWAQVNGRNAISWEKKFELDVWYVDNKSFWLDIKILWLTILKVFKSEGISSKTSVTMEKFKGSKS